MNQARWRDYWRAASPLLAYGVLAVLWYAVLRQFYGAMAPRLGHLGPGGLAISDWPCGCPQCDFSGFWPAGILARAGRVAEIYDPASFLAARHAIFSPQAELVRWFYPPPAFLPALAISYIPFEAAFWAWTLVSIVAAILLLRFAGLRWTVILVSMLSPAALWNAELGQFGTMTGAMIVASLTRAERSPIVAGALLGGLVIKPQAGLLVAFAMLGRLNWRALAAAAAVALAMSATVTWLLGWDVWRIYLSAGVQESKTVLDAVFPAAGYEKFGVSVFWMLRNFGVGIGPATVVQAISAFISAVLVVRIWRRPENWPRDARMALTVLLSLLVPPYGYTDDMVAYSVALAAMAAARNWRIDLLDVLFWMWPALCPIVFLRTGALLTPVVVVAAVARLLWRPAPPGRASLRD